MPGGGQGGYQGGGQQDLVQGMKRIPREVAAPENGGQFYQPFRPPPSQEMDSTSNIDETFQILRERRRPWYILAKSISSLQAMGIPPNMIDDETGITGREQNEWKVAANVHAFLQEAPDIPPGVMEFFEDGAVSQLYELRVLGANERVKGAIYVAQNQCTAKEVIELTKAMKDYNIRAKAAGQEGFSDSCGDALAMKCYRDATEERYDGDVNQVIQKGLEYATSEEAKVALSRLIRLNDSEEEAEEAKVDSVTLSQDEQSFWPMPVAGDLSTITSTELIGCPHTAGDGPFRIFKPSTGYKWTCLPLFRPISLADDPVAITVSSCALLKDVKNKTLQSSQGECLLIVDRGSRTPKAAAYYLVWKKSSIVGLGGSDVEQVNVISGADISDDRDLRVGGEVVLAVRPAEKQKALYNATEGTISEDDL
ncbi:Rik1-associated factor 1, variant 2 [Cymbomonas tetramitiformis]|uniref:Rik1-associated factor 1, variant 2 n=1 Tax=Cymbomonas tetramitiformis TaxID=36881 RepID=A0AAE0BZT0_9CHLO|nr:Rik1-associated factor 1, variant 2 [Cymbomonas tetramitiformis]